MKALNTAHGAISIPAFLPDGTRGVVRALDAADVAGCGIGAVMVNALHLSTAPGATVVRQMGGIHRFMDWDRPIMSDSGGFQIFSLIAENPRNGSISRQGFTYRIGAKKQVLTPEKCIQKQVQIGADVLFCLDYCTPPDADDQTQRDSVALTVAWAARCKAEFQKRKREGTQLFAVVQGGGHAGLRRECADRLVEMGFDGFGFGGWPISGKGRLADAVGLVADLLPPGSPKHALGIGKPENVVAAFRLGYDTFDCTLPTRDARQKRLYAFTQDDGALDGDFYQYLYICDERYARDAGPVDETCDCPCCMRYSRAYLHHLYGLNETLAFRLGTLHNLRFYARLMARLQRGAETEKTAMPNDP